MSAIYDPEEVHELIATVRGHLASLRKRRDAIVPHLPNIDQLLDDSEKALVALEAATECDDPDGFIVAYHDLNAMWRGHDA